MSRASEAKGRGDFVADRVATLHRDHYRELLAPLIRIAGSFAEAEDIAQEVFARALERWNDEGVPDEPLAWLRRSARNAAIDRYRRARRWREKEAALTYEADRVFLDDHEALIRDDLLRLIFTCCHPSLAPAAQLALTLRTVAGLSSEEVARSLLLETTTLQQRIVRAKKKIDAAAIPYEVPGTKELPARLRSVLRVVYLIFNEGYGATSGEGLMRPRLCAEAIRLGRLLRELLPEESGTAGLLALMLLHDSRRDARVDSNGDLITLDEQDRRRWDVASITEALPLVDLALSRRPASSYAVEAAIAALHARAPTAAETDWPQIARLYVWLERESGGSPVVALNAAVARALAGELEAGLARLDELEQSEALGSYHLLPAARADLLARSGRGEEARVAYERALSLATNEVERRFLRARRARLS